MGDVADRNLLQAWRQMATESFSAATRLVGRGQSGADQASSDEGPCWRSAISRAYYAAYARIVAGLLRCGVTMPAKGNPSHLSLPVLVLNNLTTLDRGPRSQLSGVIVTLYKLRIAADYQPRAVVDQAGARESAALMARVFRVLKEAES